jgi:hypothetical protein
MDNFKPKAPRVIGDLLGGIRALALIRAWHECAGPALLKQTRFMGLRPAGNDLELAVEVPDPVWRQELEFQKNEILSRYRAALRNEGFSESELPSRCSLGGAVSSLPLKSVDAKKRGSKKRV